MLEEMKLTVWKGGILVNKQRCVRVSHDSCKPAFFLLAYSYSWNVKMLLKIVVLHDLIRDLIFNVLYAYMQIFL